MRRFGELLLEKRGGRSRAEFARELGLSYTFVREMEAGNRFPSEGTIPDLASKLGVDGGYLALLVHCDRSPLLTDHLVNQGVRLPTAEAEESARQPSGDGGVFTDRSGRQPPTGHLSRPDRTGTEG
jgi:transcriptional regulator with XRE-family HTH domain